MGEYTQRIKFISEGTTSDGYGGVTPSETVVLETWAYVEQLPRSKTLEQVQERINLSYRVSIQTRKGFEINETYMVEWKGKRFQIITGGVTDDVLQNIETTFDICQL